MDKGCVVMIVKVKQDRAGRVRGDIMLDMKCVLEVHVK